MTNENTDAAHDKGGKKKGKGDGTISPTLTRKERQQRARDAADGDADPIGVGTLRGARSRQGHRAKPHRSR